MVVMLELSSTGRKRSFQKLTSVLNQIKHLSQRIRKICREYLDNQKDITEVYQELSYDELSDLNNWFTHDNEESTEESKEESVPDQL